jgi:hypothetical protein
VFHAPKQEVGANMNIKVYKDNEIFLIIEKTEDNENLVYFLLNKNNISYTSVVKANHKTYIEYSVDGVPIVLVVGTPTAEAIANNYEVRE